MHSPDITRRRVTQLLAAAPALAAWPQAHAQGKQPSFEQYREVKPIQPTENTAKIEVVDFFWYGCPACNAFLPTLVAWKKKLPADVSYRYLPVAFDGRNEPHTRIYYTLDALNKVEELHTKVFAVLHGGGKRQLRAPDEIADFAASNGIDKKLWLDTYNSFAVGTRVKRAQQVWFGYRIDGTPSIGIDGRFVTAPSMAGSGQESLEVTDALIDQLRRQRSGKK